MYGEESAEEECVVSDLKRVDKEKIDFEGWGFTDEEVNAAQIVLRDVLLEPPGLPPFVCLSTTDEEERKFIEPLAIEVHIEPFIFRATLRSVCMYELLTQLGGDIDVLSWDRQAISTRDQ